MDPDVKSIGYPIRKFYWSAVSTDVKRKRGITIAYADTRCATGRMQSRIDDRYEVNPMHQSRWRKDLSLSLIREGAVP